MHRLLPLLSVEGLFVGVKARFSITCSEEAQLSSFTFFAGFLDVEARRFAGTTVAADLGLICVVLNPNASQNLA